MQDPPGHNGKCVGTLEDRKIEAQLDPVEYRTVEGRFAVIKDNSSGDDSLRKQSAATTKAAFKCSICYVPYEPYEGVSLRDCLHSFCRKCLVSSIKHAEDVVVKCPYKDNSCENIIQDRDIRTVLSAEDYRTYLERTLNKTERTAFHCKTPDCAGWCLAEDNVSWSDCPFCQAKICLKPKGDNVNSTGSLEMPAIGPNLAGFTPVKRGSMLTVSKLSLKPIPGFSGSCSNAVAPPSECTRTGTLEVR
nr:ranBP-type and C3HC4-type zinc finger-containing protein 1 [Aedes albopictus]